MMDEEHVHDLIRSQLVVKAANLRNSFLNLDEDHSGRVSKGEFYRMLQQFNLTAIRKKAVHKMFDTIDKNGDGFESDEFCRLMTSNDTLPLR